MGPALEFILKITDLLSPGMMKAAGVTDNAAARIAGDIEKINASSNHAGNGVNELASEFGKLNGIKISAGSMLGSFVGGNLITNGIQKVGSLISEGISTIISDAAKEQQQLVGLTTFLGKSGAAEAFANIKKDAAATPFDTDSLLMVNRALISAGVNAKDARSDTMNLANAIAAVGGGNEELSRMATNLQQIKTVGKASALDIKQFGYAGINIYQLLANATGKSIEQVREMDVSYELLSKSLAMAGQQGGIYYGALAAQAQTITGKQSTLMDNLHQAAAKIGTALQPLLNWLLDIGIRLSENFGSILQFLQPVIDVLNAIPNALMNISSGTSEWGAYIDVVRSFLNYSWLAIQSIAGNVWHILSGIINWVRQSSILKDIFWLIGKFGETIWFVIAKIGDVLQWIWDRIIYPIIHVIEWVYEKVKSLLGFGGNDVKVTQEVKTTADAKKGIDPLSLNAAGATGTAPGGKLAAIDTPKAKSEGINSGGQRSVTININKQIEKIENHIVGGGKEVADEIESAVKEAMRRVLYSLNGSVAN